MACSCLCPWVILPSFATPRARDAHSHSPTHHTPRTPVRKRPDSLIGIPALSPTSTVKELVTVVWVLTPLPYGLLLTEGLSTPAVSAPNTRDTSEVGWFVGVLLRLSIERQFEGAHQFPLPLNISAAPFRVWSRALKPDEVGDAADHMARR